jgi:2-oxoglutarate ferredoxin oxidoreductase subunit alpha
MEKVLKNKDDIVEIQEYAMEDAEYAVVCFGGTTRAVMEAVKAAREKGLKVGMWRPVTVWPYPERSCARCCPGSRGC